MGQCCTKRQNEVERPHKQKNIDDKRMLKVGIEVLKKDFCIQIGYNRRAVKNYTDVKVIEEVVKNPQSTNNENTETEESEASGLEIH